MVPLFPLFFIAVWLLVTGILAGAGGWSELARLYPEPADDPRSPVAAFPGASLSLRRERVPMPVNYSHFAVVGILPAGLHLGVWAIFRFRHPPLLIPWSQIERMVPGRMLLWQTLTIHPRGTSTRIRLYGAVAQAVQEVAWKSAARTAEPAPA